MMIVRDKLLSQMTGLSEESKWDESLQDWLSQLLQVRPTSPYIYVQHKISLRQKFDNSRTSQYLIQLTLFVTKVDPLVIGEQAIKDRVIGLCVEKYQHTKIKKTQIQQFIGVILLPISTTSRQLYLKLLEPTLDREIYTILQFSDYLYQTILYRAVMEEIGKLQDKLQEAKVQLNKSILTQYINTISEQNSILKQLSIDLQQEGQIQRVIAASLIERLAS